MKIDKKVILTKDAIKNKDKLIDEKFLRCIELKNAYVVYKTMGGITSVGKFVTSLKMIYDKKGIEVNIDWTGYDEIEKSDYYSFRISQLTRAVYDWMVNNADNIQSEEDFLNRNSGLNKKTQKELIFGK